MKTFRLLCILLLTMTALTGVSNAQTLDFWFGDLSGTPVTSVDVAQGSTFDVSLWYQTSDVWAHNAMELLVGFDRTTSIGASATSLDGEISLVSVSNIAFPIVLANNLGGGFNPSAGDRPYGVHLALGAALGTTVTAWTPARIADLSLSNDTIPQGNYYDMTIWDAGAGNRWTSFAPMFSEIRRDATAAALRVNSVAGPAPEYTTEEWKALGDGEQGKLVAIEVTIDVGDSFFVEEAGRSSGIRVAKLASETYIPGARATVTGTIETNSNGERYISPSDIVTAADSVTILPVGMANKSLGGYDWLYNSGTGEGQMGVKDGSGLNNVGLLVQAWGEPVLIGETDAFRIDDGSGMDVRVQLPAGQAHGWDAGSVPSYVSATGASGLMKQLDDSHTSMIYIGDFATDVTTFAP